MLIGDCALMTHRSVNFTLKNNNRLYTFHMVSIKSGIIYGQFDISECSQSANPSGVCNFIIIPATWPRGGRHETKISFTLYIIQGRRTDANLSDLS